MSDTAPAPADVPGSDSVRVIGHGAASGAPDIGVLRVSAEATEESPAAALTGASRALAAMLAALRAAGLADTDLQTSGASVNDWHDEQRARRYHGSQHLTAVVRDLARIGSLVSELIDAGGAAARLHGMSFSFADAEALTRAAREAAWHDAVARARQYAELAGRQLGAVRQIAERPDGGQPRRRSAREAASVSLSSAMPVEAGENEITATVEVEWALVD